MVYSSFVLSSNGELFYKPIYIVCAAKYNTSPACLAHALLVYVADVLMYDSVRRLLVECVLHNATLVARNSKPVEGSYILVCIAWI